MSEQIRLTVAIWYHDRAGQVQSITCPFQGSLEHGPVTLDVMMRAGVQGEHNGRMVFIPPHRIVEITWERA